MVSKQSTGIEARDEGVRAPGQAVTPKVDGAVAEMEHRRRVRCSTVSLSKNTPATAFMAFHTRLLWLSITPLDLPVVPPV